MLPYMTENFGNPHSRTHFYGWEAEEAVEKARAVSISISHFEQKRNVMLNISCIFVISQNIYVQ